LKQRIDLLALLLVLGSAAPLGAQDVPAEPDPLGQLDEGDRAEPAPDAPVPEADAAPEQTPPPSDDALPEVGAEAGAELGGDAAVEIAPEPAAQEPAPPPSEGDIVVTGSRIKSAFNTAAPVDIIDRKQLEYSGATNLADVVQYLTVASGTGPTGEGALPTGTSYVNLRGLGAGATLVLLNGRRLGPSGGGIEQHYEDLSIIPLAAVERLEILKGGGSAIYGADAVGGVVNIITRRNWNGVRVEGDALTTTKFDHAEYGASVSWGSTGERTRLLTAFGVFTRDDLTGADRDFTSRYSISRQGNPATYYLGATPMADPGCAKGPASTLMPQDGGGSICAFDAHRWLSLMGNLQRINAYASGEYDLTNHTTLFGELVASRSRQDGILAPSFVIPPPLPTVPADHVDNPFGQPVMLLGRALGAANGPARFSTDDDTMRVVAGLKGDFEGIGGDSKFATWEWEISGGVNVSRYLSQITDTLRDRFQSALNSCSDPNDVSACFNPFLSAVDGTGTPNSQAVIDGFTSLSQNLTDHGLAMYNAGMNGSLFELPGGDLGLAFGAEMRHEWRQSQEDHDSNEQQFAFLLGNSDAKAVRNIYSGYAELRWPFYDGVELQTALRIEHYDDIKQTTPSPFAGLTLTPAEIPGRNNVAPAFRRLQLRGQITSAFRAPTIYQSFPGFAVVPTLFTVTTIPSFVPVKNIGNPKLDPERALVITAGLQWQIIDEIGLSGEFWSYDYKDRIRPENSKAFVADYVANPMAPHPNVIVDPVSGEIQRVDVTQRNSSGHITTDGIDFGVLFTLTGATFGGDKSDWGSIAFGAQGTYTLNYLFPRAEAGAIPVPNTMPARNLPPPNCSGDECQAVGSRNVANFTNLPLPQWRVNFPLVFLYEGHSASAMGHFISDLVDDNNVLPGDKLGHVDAQFTFDLQYGYTIKDWIGKELTARIGMYNVLDAVPPSANATAGYDVMLYDPRGRMVYAKLISQF
jgi:outer membrane receptor protein involved in Fe transport